MIFAENPTVWAVSGTSPDHRHAGDGGRPSTCSKTRPGSAIEPALIEESSAILHESVDLRRGVLDRDPADDGLVLAGRLGYPRSVVPDVIPAVDPGVGSRERAIRLAPSALAMFAAVPTTGLVKP